MTSDSIDDSLTQTLGYDALNHLVTVSSGADNENYDADAKPLTQVRILLRIANELTMRCQRSELDLTGILRAVTLCRRGLPFSRQDSGLAGMFTACRIPV
ncbi:MAG: hypothetical protein ACREPQ_11695 [Rhodanobacter sp.]